jgi:hypothetical protein
MDPEQMGAWLARGTHILKDLSSKNRCQFFMAEE